MRFWLTLLYQQQPSYSATGYVFPLFFSFWGSMEGRWYVVALLHLLLPIPCDLQIGPSVLSLELLAMMTCCFE